MPEETQTQKTEPQYIAFRVDSSGNIKETVSFEDLNEKREIYNKGYFLMDAIIEKYGNEYPNDLQGIPLTDPITKCWFWEDWIVPCPSQDPHRNSCDLMEISKLTINNNNELILTFDSVDYDGFNGYAETTVTIPSNELFTLIAAKRRSWITDRKHAPIVTPNQIKRPKTFQPIPLKTSDPEILLETLGHLKDKEP